MTGIIYCQKLENGLAEFEKLINSYKKIDIKIIGKIRTTNYSRDVYFENGDHWLIVKATDNARGHACNIAYIDFTIPTNIINEIILPSIKSFPYQAYHYYNY